jgi:hypothetical protein
VPTSSQPADLSLNEDRTLFDFDALVVFFLQTQFYKIRGVVAVPSAIILLLMSSCCRVGKSAKHLPHFHLILRELGMEGRVDIWRAGEDCDGWLFVQVEPYVLMCL